MNFLFSKPKIMFNYGKKLSNLSLNVEDNALSILKYHYNKTFHVFYPNFFVQKSNYRNVVILSEKYIIKWDIVKSHLEIIDNAKNKINEDILTNFDRNIMFENQMKFIIKDLNIKNKNKKSLYSNFFETNLITHKLLTSLTKNKNV